MATKKKPATKKSPRRTVTKKAARTSRLRRILTGGFEAKKLIFVTSGFAIVLVLGFTGYALFQKFSASATANISTSGYEYIGESHDFKFYMCRNSTYSQVKGVVKYVGATKWHSSADDGTDWFEGQFQWMTSLTDPYSNKGVGNRKTADLIKNHGVAVSESGLSKSAVVRLFTGQVGEYYSTHITLKSLDKCS